jgi:hypothetical protein
MAVDHSAGGPSLKAVPAHRCGEPADAGDAVAGFAAGVRSLAGGRILRGPPWRRPRPSSPTRDLRQVLARELEHEPRPGSGSSARRGPIGSRQSTTREGAAGRRRCGLSSGPNDTRDAGGMSMSLSTRWATANQSEHATVAEVLRTVLGQLPSEFFLDFGCLAARGRAPRGDDHRRERLDHPDGDGFPSTASDRSRGGTSLPAAATVPVARRHHRAFPATRPPARQGLQGPRNQSGRFIALHPYILELLDSHDGTRWRAAYARAPRTGPAGPRGA